MKSFTLSGYTLIALILIFAGRVSLAESMYLESPATKVNVLELYTSQGCSSCPPAEKWLTRFEGAPGLWTEFIPINFHVDYWDYIGWRDPFANPAFTHRQRLYERLELSKNVATPGFIVNGQGWNGWFWGQEPSFEKQPAKGIIKANIDLGQIQIEFAPVQDSLDLPSQLRVHVAILGFDTTTKVTAGENEGRELKHDFVVLAYDQQLMKNAKALAKASMKLPDASAFQVAKTALVVWVSDKINPSPIQAVGDWL